jgi:hypothetical protein
MVAVGVELVCTVFALLVVVEYARIGVAVLICILLSSRDTCAEHHKGDDPLV